MSIHIILKKPIGKILKKQGTSIINELIKVN